MTKTIIYKIKNAQDESCIPLSELETILDDLNNNSNFGIRDVHPTRRSLSIVTSRHKVNEKNLSPIDFSTNKASTNLTLITSSVRGASQLSSTSDAQGQ